MTHNNVYALSAILGARASDFIEMLMTHCDTIKDTDDLTEEEKFKELMSIVSTFSRVVTICSDRISRLVE